MNHSMGTCFGFTPEPCDFYTMKKIGCYVTDDGLVYENGQWSRSIIGDLMGKRVSSVILIFEKNSKTRNPQITFRKKT